MGLMRKFQAIAVFLVLGSCTSADLQEKSDAIEILPQVLSFGRVGVGGELEGWVSVRNLGRGTFNGSITSLPEGGELSLSEFSIPQGGDLEVLVRYRPKADGPFSVDFGIGSGSGGWGTIRVEGVATSQPLNVVSELKFGSVLPGNERTQEARMRNRTDGELLVQVVLEGSSAFQASTESIELSPQGEAIIPVSFSPKVIGESFGGGLVLEPCEGCPLQKVLLSGDSHVIDLESDPESIDFGFVAAGARAERQLVLLNTGSKVLDLQVYQPGDSRVRVEPSGSYRGLEPGSSTRFRLVFGPELPRELKTSLVIDEAEGSSLLSIPIEGVAVAAIEAVPNSLSFEHPAGMLVKRTVELQGFDRQREILITDVRIEGEGAEAFILSPPPIGTTVGRNRQSIFVSYQSSVGTDDRAVLVVETAEPAARVITVPLFGKVIGEDCEIEPFPGLVHFGVLPANGIYSRSIDIKNVGESPCFVWGARVSGRIEELDGFRLIALEEERTFYPGEHVEFLVESLSGEESRVASAEIRFNRSGADPTEQAIRLQTGRSRLDLEFIPSPSSTIDFGQVPIGTMSVERFAIRTSELQGQVGEITFSEGSSRRFRLANSNPALPVVVGQEEVIFEVEFNPLTPGRSYGQIELNFRWGSQDIIRFDLRGTGVLDAE